MVISTHCKIDQKWLCKARISKRSHKIQRKPFHEDVQEELETRPQDASKKDALYFVYLKVIDFTQSGSLDQDFTIVLYDGNV